MECTVFAVDRYQLSSRRLAKRLHDGPCGNQTFLVGERQPLTRPEGFNGDLQTSEAHNTIDDDVGTVDQCSRISVNHR